jgi:hypothetical protein
LVVNTIFLSYIVYMAQRQTKPLNFNIDKALLDRVEKYRFKRMFATRTEAIEFLLDAALKLNPERPTPKGE